MSSIRILNTSTNIESDIPCTKILIAAGCWSPEVFSTLFPKSTFKLPINSLAGHSLVVRAPNWNEELEEKECQAVFASDEEGYCPEIFLRKGGDIYVAGLNSSTEPLPKLATESKFQEDVIQRLENTARRIFGVDERFEIKVVRKGLCFRPVTKRGTPILAKVVDDNLGGVSTRKDRDGGIWLAAGHGPWGISMSLGTGKVMAEMIQGKPTSADVSKLGF